MVEKLTEGGSLQERETQIPEIFALSDIGRIVPHHPLCTGRDPGAWLLATAHPSRPHHDDSTLGLPFQKRAQEIGSGILVG